MVHRQRCESPVPLAISAAAVCRCQYQFFGDSSANKQPTQRAVRRRGGLRESRHIPTIIACDGVGLSERIMPRGGGIGFRIGHVADNKRCRLNLLVDGQVMRDVGVDDEVKVGWGTIVISQLLTLPILASLFARRWSPSTALPSTPDFHSGIVRLGS